MPTNPLPLFELLLKLAKEVKDLVQEKKTLKKERRVAIANYLDNIGEVLTKISESLRAKKVPKRLCDELDRYVWEVDAFLGEVELGTRLELRDLVAEAHIAPPMAISALEEDLSVLTRPNKRTDLEKNIRTIEKASAIFKTTAQKLRIPQ